MTTQIRSKIIIFDSILKEKTSWLFRRAYSSSILVNFPKQNFIECVYVCIYLQREILSKYSVWIGKFFYKFFQIFSIFSQASSWFSALAQGAWSSLCGWWRRVALNELETDTSACVPRTSATALQHPCRPSFSLSSSFTSLSLVPSSWPKTLVKIRWISTTLHPGPKKNIWSPPPTQNCCECSLV